MSAMLATDGQVSPQIVTAFFLFILFWGFFLFDLVFLQLLSQDLSYLILISQNTLFIWVWINLEGFHNLTC